MGNSSINAYDGVTQIPGFRGLLQYGDTDNGNPSYAVRAHNVDTLGGVLMPMAAPTAITDGTPYELPIETLMRISNRWDEHARGDILVAACDGQLYYWGTPDDESEEEPAPRWISIDMPPGVDSFASCVFSWVDYEINEYDETGEAHTVDVLLCSNAEDGMFLLRGDTMELSQVATQYRFGVIERHAERIWGTAISDEPDLLAYSAPYDPTDWAARSPDITPDEETEWIKQGQPEDGAGVIKQPTWDGDSFTALRAFGDQLIAFKRTRVFRIYGTDPGTYEIRQQYGGGAPMPYTIAVDRERIYMLTPEGVSAYDGNVVEPYQREYASEVFGTINREAMSQACGCLWRDKYYLAFPTGSSAVNDAVLTYDLHDGVWNLRTDLKIESWLPGENALYFTTNDEPCRAWAYHENAWETGEATDGEQLWLSPWQTVSHRMLKGPFTVFFRPEVQTAPCDLTVSIMTERGLKQKTIRVHPMLDYEQNADREAKVRRVPFSSMGRRFRIAITAPAGSPVWRIAGGVEITFDHETE